jgi:putative restriction endonuclease
MRRFWWVNHKQTVQQEIAGGYLWSPKREANDSRSQFYDNMREATPGDFVLSFADGEIGFVGTVADCAISAPKPDEFGSTGKNWSTIGWLLPVAWQELSRRVRPKSFLSEIAPLLPAKYSPLNAANGNGNQKAYLAEISEQLFQVLAAHSRFHGFQGSRHRPSAGEFIEAQEAAAQKSIENDLSLSDTEKEQLIKARKGQGNFRDRVFEVERCCRITGLKNPSLLVASHIKPWRWCVTAAERLDKFNGLLLAPHVDRLFDRGFMTFSDEGDVIISDRLPYADLVILGLQEICTKNAGLFFPEQKVYLEYHRRVIFQGSRSPLPATGDRRVTRPVGPASALA